MLLPSLFDRGVLKLAACYVKLLQQLLPRLQVFCGHVTGEYQRWHLKLERFVNCALDVQWIKLDAKRAANCPGRVYGSLLGL